MRQYFKFTFNDKQLQEDFIKSISLVGKSVFSNTENESYVFEITWVNAKSIVNEEGRYRKILKAIENIGSKSFTYKSKYGPYHFYSSIKTIFKDSKGSFPRLFNLLKKFISNYEYEEKQYNVVWYGHYKDVAVSLGGI